MPCCRPSTAYRQVPYQIRKNVAQCYADPRWLVPYYPAVSRYYTVHPAPLYDRYNPPTRKKAPRFHFPPQVLPQQSPPPPPAHRCTPQAPKTTYWPPPFPRDPLHDRSTGFELHPILSLRNIEPDSPNLFWLLYQNPFYYASWDSDAIIPLRYPGMLNFLQQAACPGVTSIRINYEFNNLSAWAKERATVITIDRQNSRIPIAVQDVLIAIHRHFMAILSPDHFNEAAAREDEGSGLFYMRALRLQHGPSDAARNVDTLGHLVRFGGLRVIEARDGVLYLSLYLTEWQRD